MNGKGHWSSRWAPTEACSSLLSRSPSRSPSCSLSCSLSSNPSSNENQNENQIRIRIQKQNQNWHSNPNPNLVSAIPMAQTREKVKRGNFLSLRRQLQEQRGLRGLAASACCCLHANRKRQNDGTRRLRHERSSSVGKCWELRVRTRAAERHSGDQNQWKMRPK